MEGSVKTKLRRMSAATRNHIFNDLVSAKGGLFVRLLALGFTADEVTELENEARKVLRDKFLTSA